jgi:hypothetical protein
MKPGMVQLFADGRFYMVSRPHHYDPVSGTTPTAIRRFALQESITRGFIRLVPESNPVPYSPDNLLAVPMRSVVEHQILGRNKLDLPCPSLPPPRPREPRFASSDDDRAYLIRYSPADRDGSEQWHATDVEYQLLRSLKRMLGSGGTWLSERP